MAKFKLSAGAELDLLTKGELDTSLLDQSVREWAERGRGVKVIRRQGSTGPISLTTGFAIQGPEQGYTWALRLLGLSLSAAQTIQAWTAGDNSPAPPANGNGPLGSMPSASFGSITWSNVQGLLEGGEFLTLSAGGACTVQYTLIAVQVPAQLLWKLV
jgi:hypothetical protein